MEGAVYNRLSGFRDTLARAATFDSWGQVLEADREYRKLVSDIQDSFSKVPLAEEQMKFLNKLAAAVLQRAKTAQDLTGEYGLRLEQIQVLIPMVAALHFETPPVFPIPDIVGLQRDLQSIIAARTSHGGKALVGMRPAGAVASPESVLSDDGEDDDGDDGGDSQQLPDLPAHGGKRAKSKKTTSKSAMDGGDNLASTDSSGAGAAVGVGAGTGTLLPMKHFPGQTGITIRILKIRMKDPTQYLEPFFTVSIKDEDGSPLRGGEPQDTPPAKHHDGFVVFDQDVHLQIPYDQMPEQAAVFLEFKHFKFARQKISTKCWCLLEKDELASSEELPLEIYKKPTRYDRKGLKLMTNLEFYLYVRIIRHEP
eukprot:m.291600 g.291600  ORF g.291600 m.291600 type:complete len:367 (-) comp19980_c0_seq2:199-1299(-)